MKRFFSRRIFFALASPVFHAMFYGTIKEEGNVEITDVSVEAFLCLQKYGVFCQLCAYSLDDSLLYTAIIFKVYLYGQLWWCIGG